MPSDLLKAKPLVKRELLGINKNALLLLIILLLPIALGFMFGTFRDILPRGTPSLVLKSNENVSDADMRLTAAIVSGFSSPTVVNSTDIERYTPSLLREESYFIVLAQRDVVHGIRNVVVYVDYSMSPVSELAPYVSSTMAYEIQRNTGITPTIDVRYIGKRILPFEYFVPGIMILLAAAVGLLVIPFTTAKDAQVMPRVMKEVSSFTFFSSKLVFALFLVFVQLLLFLVTQRFTGLNSLSMINLNLLSLYVIFVTTVFTTALGLFVIFVFGFTELGKQVNALIFGAIVIFSGIFYPVGFFPTLPEPILNSAIAMGGMVGISEGTAVSAYSSISILGQVDAIFGNLFQSIARVFPTYYSTVSLRGFGVRDLGFGLLEDYLLTISVSAMLMVLMLHFAVARFRKYG